MAINFSKNGVQKFLKKYGGHKKLIMSTQNLIENNQWISVQEVMHRLQSIGVQQAFAQHGNEYFNVMFPSSFDIAVVTCIYTNPDDTPFITFPDTVAIAAFGGNARVHFEIRGVGKQHLVCDWESRPHAKKIMSQMTNCFVVRCKDKEHCLLKKFDRTIVDFQFAFLRFKNFPSYSTTKQLVVEAITEIEDSNEAEDFSNLVMEYL